MRPKLATVLLVAALAAAFGAIAADRQEQRVACQDESRLHIKGSRRVDVGLYMRLVERRQLYILDCMEDASRDVEQAGAIPLPQPPARPILLK